ncbi:MAG: bepA [Fibrobacteres bacterium]|nr:bepA [Fibrobacterota bacterium]
MPAAIRSVPRFAAALFSLLFFVQCAGFFSGAGKALVSDADEAKLGAEFNKTLTTNDTARQEMPVFVPKNQAQTDLQNYIVGLAQEIVAALPANEKPNYNFTYTLIDKDVENAFAVPGGYVYIYTGILKKMTDEAELVGVLGHEITHVSHHHYRKQLAKNAALGLALQTALIASNAGQGSQLAAGAAFQLAGMKFTRTDESDADKGGTLILGRMSRNPLGIAKYFTRAKSQGVPEWLSDHPGNSNRVKAVTKVVNGDPALMALAADSSRTNFRDRYQQHIGAL